ncbi:MAG: daunorubicin ABC transporter permease [bacterium]|nr:daunorubicin ABC transporter permease [bacterium]
MNRVVENQLAPWRRGTLATYKLHGNFIRLAFLKFLAYRLRYYTGVVTYTIYVAGFYYLYNALFASRLEDGSSDLIGGLTLDEMITYVAISWIGRSFYFNNIAREISGQIREGQIAMQLIKPYNIQTVMMFEVVGESAFRLLMFTLPIMLVVVPLFGINGPPDSALYVWSFISFCLALVIYTQLNFLLGCMAFFTQNIQGVLRAKMVALDFLTGVIVPFTFFPESIQKMMNWLPFQSISYIPVTIYLGKRTGPDLWQGLVLQLAWAVGLYLLGRLIWSLSVRHVIVQGG